MKSAHATGPRLIGAAILLSSLGLACDNADKANAAGAAPAGQDQVAVGAKRRGEEDQDARLDAFLEEVFEWEVARSPVFEANLGRKTVRYGDWDDESDAHALRLNERRKADLARLHAEFDYDALSAAAKVSFDVFEFTQEQALRDFEFRDNVYLAHHLDSFAVYLPVLLRNMHRIDTLEDAQAYISRLQKTETVLGQIAARLKRQTERGILAPAFVYPYLTTDLSRLIGGQPLSGDGDNVVYDDFRSKVAALNIAEETKSALLEDAAAALRGGFTRGYRLFLAEVERARARATHNDGVWTHPNGAAYYDNRIRHYTTLELTADDIHELGLAEVSRIQAEMGAIQSQVGFDGTLREFFGFIRKDPANYFPNTDEGREQFLERTRGLVDAMYAVADDYFNLLPKAKLEVLRVEPFRQNTAGIAFYSQPSADGSRPGRYYTNLADMTGVQKYVHTAIAYHESVPGHHFQLALQQEMTDLPSFRRYGGNGAFIEGWALYAERLAREIGFYSDPFEDLGRLQNEIWRAVRLVVDTGLHTRRWTRQQAIDYFLENTPLSVADATAEVERYIVRPGQALSYKIGMLKIQALRAKAETELGTDFDIRAFHDVVLRNGAVPLGVLETLIAEHIAARRP